MKSAKTEAVALTPAQRHVLEDIATGKGDVEKDGAVWLYKRQERAAAKKLMASGFLHLIGFRNRYIITNAGRAALKAPLAALCAGCDAALPKSTYSDGPGGYAIEIAPHVSVRVCYGRGRGQPSVACIVKARERARRCPGCGAEDTKIGDICKDCTTNIERGRTLKDRKLEWWCIVANGLGPYLAFDVERGQGRSGSNRAYPLEELAKLLVTALAVGRIDAGHRYGGVGDDNRIIPCGHGVRIDGSDKFHVEVTHEQGEAMAALVKAIRQVMYLSYRDGLADGKDALGRLARGDTSVRDFERHDDEQEKRLDQILAEFEDESETKEETDADARAE